MGRGFYRDIAKILKAYGFSKIDGGKGSHEKWVHPDLPHPVIVPRNLYRRHIANKILKKDAGIDKKI